ncbi:MAG: ATP-binding cassette domain-containing protein [Chloroflexi bacterium]|nr:ATP-binding cassette domain-containing protein [Chloroflexota bacterium]
MAIIEVEELVKKFGNLTAVDQVSFEVQEGEIFGFLGPNGAGKTTTINMLCTLLKPSSGRARLNGFDVVTQRDEVRGSLGLVFQDPTLDDRLTAEENLDFHALLYGVPGEERASRKEQLLTMLGLWERRKDLIKIYSGGMKRRLEIARGLLHHPRVLFLDEPTLGLDPQTRKHIWEYILDLREKEGITIFFTTHYMDEAEHAQRIGIIDYGKIVALDTPDKLKDLVGGDIVTLRTQNDVAMAQHLAAEYNLSPQNGSDGLRFEIQRGAEFIPQLVRKAPVEVLAVQVHRPTLDDVFLKLTGHQIREEEASVKDRMRERAKIWRGRSH